VVTCFSDTAEISTIPGAPGVIHDSIYCSRVHIVIPDPEDPEAPPTEEEHFTFTFAFDGDLDIKSGDQVAFTGPSAVEGLKLISVEDGPWFTVLGGTCDWDQQVTFSLFPGAYVFSFMDLVALEVDVYVTLQFTHQSCECILLWIMLRSTG
jgi:hypothetical protein